MSVRAAFTANHSTRAAFWLVPAPRFHTLFSQIIAKLADEFGAPRFEPHVTLHSTRLADPGEMRALAGRAARQFATLELTAGSTATTADLFQTLFVEIAATPTLERLRDFLRQGSPEETIAVRRLHLSLLYRELPEYTRADLVQRYAFDGKRIAFDRIAAVRPGDGEDDWLKVEKWVTLLRAELAPQGGQRSPL